jgi:1-aminocyclopropane-1-carboxylate deaminase
MVAAALPAARPTPLTAVEDPEFTRAGARLLLKRDDLLHPTVPGNKWRKLAGNLAAALDAGHDTILTFGGAYSNHIAATAAAGAALGLATVGVIRGEEHRPLNPVLAAATAGGMRLTYLDRAAYRAVRAGDRAPVAALVRAWGPCYVIPEGGGNELAVRGCAELAGEIRAQAPAAGVVCCPVGTGGTLAGLAAGLADGGGAVRVIGVAVLRGGFLADEVAALQRRTFGAVSTNWTVADGYHHGGYARRTPELDGFVAGFAERHGVRLDPVYTGKMMFGLHAMAADGAFTPGTTVVAVVTG